jgi:hypothetical protein
MFKDKLNMGLDQEALACLVGKIMKVEIRFLDASLKFIAKKACSGRT